MSFGTATRTLRTLLGAGSIAVLWASTAVAAPTGQERAEAAGRGLVGTPAPALVLRTIDGESIDLGALYGKQAVYLKFWATWCGPCRAQMPHFERTYEEAGPGLAVIGVDVGFNDSFADVRDAIRELGLKMPTAIDDGQLAAAFNLRVTPQHIVIGRDGRVQYVGQLADAKLDAALRAAQAVPVSAATQAHAATPTTIKHYGIGDALPNLTAEVLDGTVVHAREPNDRRPTVLVFQSPWCETYYVEQATPTPKPPRPALAASCREVREQIAALATRQDKVRWLGVASGLWSTPDELREYEKQYSPGLPLTMDESGAWFRAFDVMRVPTIVIADANGKIAKRIEGFDAALDGEIEHVLATRE